MYFLVLYELFPQFLFEGQNFLFTLVMPLVVVVIGLNRKKINLKNLSLKSLKGKKTNDTSFENPTSDKSIDTMVSDSTSENSDIEALLAGASSEKSAEGSSEIEALLAGASSEKSAEGSSEIEALLAGEESTVPVENSLENTDTNLLVMEKMEPLENDIQIIKTDFDQFKQDLINVKEEIDGLTDTFETTLTDIKLLTTDLANPLNFMQDDSFKKNIQTINVDELTTKLINSTQTEKSESKVPEPTEPKVPESTEHKVPESTEPKVPESTEPKVPESTEKDVPNLPEDVITLVDELSKDFAPEQVFELTKIHCKTSKITLDEIQLISIIDKRNNSDFLKKKFNRLELEESPEKSQLPILKEEI